MFAQGVKRGEVLSQPRPNIVLMTFFRSGGSVRKPRSLAITGLLVLAIVSLAAIPSGYVIQRPGAVFNVMAEVENKPVISSQDLESYPSESKFDVTTISLLGNRESNPNWIQVLFAWADPSQVVLPLDEVFPPSKTTEQVRAESTAQMEISQQDAIAVALDYLGYEVPRRLYVNAVIEKTPAAGKVIAGDYVVSAGGVKVETFEELREQITKTEGAEMELGLERDGKLIELRIKPQARDDSYYIGAMVGYTYVFPKKISLQLGDVGGPSGGLMFSLGIVDRFTPGSLAGKNHIAGTGTISGEGKVGPIGGIRLKMIAAERAGADLFLVPSENCEEAEGFVPEGLRAVSVANFQEAIQAIDRLNSGDEFSPLSCKSN